MEGLMLAQLLRKLSPDLPARNLGWAFPDETTAALLLEGVGNLVMSYRPPNSVIYIANERLRGEPNNPFQRLLNSRLRGDVLLAEQLKLDRVLALHFAAAEGFVDQPAARLLFEVTGRNANLLVLEAGEEFAGKITLAAREITSSRNRFRTVRSGGLYTPPPPYSKLDPRQIDPDSAVVQSLAALPLHKWASRIDGMGPLLTAELSRRAQLPLEQPPADNLSQALAALASLVADPSVSEGALKSGAKTAARTEKTAQLRKQLREPLHKRLTLLSNQLADVERAEEGLTLASHERQEADLLMAYAHVVPPGAVEVTLPLFDGSGEKLIKLEPQLTARHNAEKRYNRARRREEVYLRLAERHQQLNSDWQQAQQQLATLEQAPLPQLEQMLSQLQLESSKSAKPLYGLRRRSPAGYEVLVGRNNKENALLTHRIGKSLDWWFHAQGYTGSHVLLRSGGRELDLPDILYAARLAAAHSKARGSSNVPVDYTRIKHVWRPRGAPAGAVHYSHQKTVFVEGFEAD